MKNYTHVLFDLDNTIFDFQAAEKNALRNVFKVLGFDLTPDLYRKFTEFNHKLQVKADQGTLTEKQIEDIRFPNFFKQELDYKVADNSKLLAAFQNGMTTSYIFRLHARDMLKKLHQQSYHLVAISNGIHQLQLDRLKKTGINKYFDHLFTSEKVGKSKDTTDFYDYVFKNSSCSLDNSIVIGSNLKTDILGANISKLDSIWYNKTHEMNISTIHPTFVVDDLSKIPDLLS